METNNAVKRKPREPLKIGLLGCGAINTQVAEHIQRKEAGPAVLSAILVQRKRPASNVLTTNDPEEFFGADWDLCVEAAGQSAVKQYGRRCLSSGRDLMITSIGCLTDDVFYAELEATAKANGSRLILCTGSMPALDWMGSAALAQVTKVSLQQSKPPKAWLGTPAYHHDLLSLTEPKSLFEGSSREAASQFPKNANVAAMLGLTTIGLDRTEARLVADPTKAQNTMDLFLEGTAGKIRISVEAAPSKENPKTSAIVALSVVKAIRKLCSPVVVGL